MALDDADAGGLIRARHQKLRALQDAGVDPYGGRFDPTHTAQELCEHVDSLEGEISTAGRIMAIRSHGKITFMDLVDRSGSIQLYFGVDEVGAERYEMLDLFDIGDILGVSGEVFRTRTGEPSVRVGQFEILSKALRPLPEKRHGLTDVDLRYRHRYLDLTVNPEARALFVTRSRILAEMRRFLDDRGYLEVETPMMSTVAGGAIARPFVTHHNALDLTLYLRIATELHLKRLLTGGLERVYEIGRVFRNEGMSRNHNPEFTMLELYQAYGDYEDMMALTESLLCHLAEKVLGGCELSYDGQTIDLSPPWRRLSLVQALADEGVDVRSWKGREDAHTDARRQGVQTDPASTPGRVMDKLIDELVMPRLVQPTFVMDHPVDISPLAKRKEDDPDFTCRFEPVIAGMEIGNAFSEINDPREQRLRFEDQLLQRSRGDDEAHVMDEDYLLSLEYGMPPAGGLGIGVDRVVMLLTGARSIRDVILFPLMRPRADDEDEDLPAVE